MIVFIYNCIPADNGVIWLKKNSLSELFIGRIFFLLLLLKTFFLRFNQIFRKVSSVVFS